ncbi:MAG: carbohydrate kinase family protein [Planctomycetaceae bacterium]|nr:carbohydrate kinase family protein [Planctomycetaceae bacterium]
MGQATGNNSQHNFDHSSSTVPLPMPIDVLCAGLIVADHVCAPIERFPPAGGLATTGRLELTIGGCAANVAVDLARLGLRVAIGGRVGND